MNSEADSNVIVNLNNLSLPHDCCVELNIIKPR